MKRKAQLNLVARAAALQLPALAPLDRAELMEALALLHHGESRQQLLFTAKAIRVSEDAQMQLLNLFRA